MIERLKSYTTKAELEADAQLVNDLTKIADDQFSLTYSGTAGEKEQADKCGKKLSDALGPGPDA